jgi:CRISPR-associated exonuclease Cas4
MRERLKLPISDTAEHFISVTDVKQYVYCPRIVYFEKVLHAKPILDSQQEDSKEKHEEYVWKELRRKDAIYYSPEFVDASKMPFVQLCSDRLGLQGTIDLIIKTKKGEYVPVDYKNMKSNHGRVWMHHKYQLTAYALLIEDCFNVLVKRGFINYIPENLILKLEITYNIKQYTKRILGSIKNTIIKERLPLVRVIKCPKGCGYQHICLDH